jgi:hypothetical protein
MKTEISITIPDKIYRGDSIDIECQVNFNLSDYKIRCELFDQYQNSIKLETPDISGVDEEISIIDATNGEFVIYVLKDTTNLFHLVSYIEIEVEDSNGKLQTIYFAAIKFQDNIYTRN